MSTAAQPYDLAFANLPEPTLLVDAAGRLVRLNGAAAALLGEGAVAAARAGEPLRAVLPWLVRALADVLEGAPAAGLEVEVEVGGARRCLGARLRRLTDGAGAPQGAVVVLEDLTARRDAEARLRSAERLAALGTLASGIAHEVNSPLACVMAGLSFVEAEHHRLAPAVGGGSLEEARTALEEARDAALRVGRIVRSLQSYGQPAVPLLRPIDLACAVRAAAALAEPELRGRGRLVLELQEGLLVRASASALAELFLALLSHVAGGLPAAGSAPAVIRVALQGDGAGARALVSTDAVEAGPPAAPPERRDLGLAVCQGIASALGGTLLVDGDPGAGAVALLRLPLAGPAKGGGLDPAPRDVAQPGR